MTPVQKIIVNPPLATVRAKLRMAGNGFPKKLQQVNKEIAKEVADETRQAYSSRYQTRSGAGAKSIRALATQTNAQVAIGGGKAPYVPGQNFGSNKIRRFAPKADPDKFLYVSVAKLREDIEEKHGEMVDELMDGAFPRTSATDVLRDIVDG